jgi:hypothetical protein
MDDAQPTIFDAYRDLLCAQFAFAQIVMRANTKMAGLWSGVTRTVDDEKPSVTAIKPEVMTA